MMKLRPPWLDIFKARYRRDNSYEQDWHMNTMSDRAFEFRDAQYPKHLDGLVLWEWEWTLGKSNK